MWCNVCSTRHRDLMLSTYDAITKHKERKLDWMIMGSEENSGTAHGAACTVLHQGKGNAEDMKAFFPKNVRV